MPGTQMPGTQTQQLTEAGRQSFKAITRIALNNWHYIDHKILTLNKSINFFTGHSGSGKSTVIDAMQIVLYANTDGRGFFNKAAADDSDRSLLEYLRGMINIGENNQAEYKRNHNFSTTIVLELEQTGSGEKECVGVIFDVETATNEIGRLFFWHRGGLLENSYRTQKRAMAIGELKSYLQHNFARDDWFYTSNNERFRRNLYDVYLGGLDMEKFPRLFKRAIPFRMNIKLEDFVKEYICMEQDIHIEDMQESVVLYGRMRRKIEDAMQEINELTGIKNQFDRFVEGKRNTESCRYRLDKLTILQLTELIGELGLRVEEGKKDLLAQKEALDAQLLLREEYGAAYDEINRQIIGSGYAELEAKQKSLEENLALLERSERRWAALSEKIGSWEEEENISNQTIWDIDKFRKGTISGEELGRLKKSLQEVRTDLEKQHQEAAAECKSLQKEADLIQKDLMEIMLGRKTYPKELEEARREIQKGLYEQFGKNIPVRILADLLDIRDEKWRNAIEGYLAWNKLALIVEPKYVKAAMEIYEQLDAKKFWRVSLVDTEKLIAQEYPVRENALAEEIECKEPYVKSFIQFLLGNVIKCEDVAKLRQCKIGVTADCLLYQNFQLRRLNPENYTRRAFIGEKSMRKRQKELQERLEELNRSREEYEAMAAAAKRLLDFEYLQEPSENYLELFQDMEEKRKKEAQLRKLEKRMEELGAGSVDILRQQRGEIMEKQKVLDGHIDSLKLQIHDREKKIEADNAAYIEKNEELLDRQRQLIGAPAWEEDFDAWFSQVKNPRYDALIRQTLSAITESEEHLEAEKNRLVDVRSEYLRRHPNRDFSASAENNGEYQQLLDELACDRIRDYEEKAMEQARVAVEHFKEDFIYKIRSAIKEAYIRRDELNRIIRKLNFGKDHYQFRISKNKGLDGEYYDMFMDESLEIDPATLSGSVEHQINMFSMDHESRYGTLMNDLIHIFIPPENASAREQEEAKKNMEKYADYRTYLSFEMEQIVEGEERLVIGLSKMIKKNSGGEGQNPLYVALLASFAQAYHINLSPKLSRRPTIRLVVLDEAFSKMDAEKVASCIELIRGLGFQAIISATNDKIQNYLENVDKTFVYANPNKRSISIQEFEKKDFSQLIKEE